MPGPYVDLQIHDFQRQFVERRTRQLVATIPVVVTTAVLIGALRLGRPVLGIPEVVLGPLVILAAVGLIAFSLTNWRCPACNSYLGKRLNPRFCASCGVQLRADATATHPV